MTSKRSTRACEPSELAHKLESLLSRIRSREIRCTSSHATLALRSLDMVKGLVKNVEDSLSGKPTRQPEGYEAMLESLASPEVNKKPAVLRETDVCSTPQQESW
jgi:chemotaxis protein histidine kinase CheA